MQIEKFAFPYFKVRDGWKCIIGVLLAVTCCLGQSDPGPRSGPASAGGYYPTLGANEQALFNQALARFLEVDSVSGTIESGGGLWAGLQW